MSRSTYRSSRRWTPAEARAALTAFTSSGLTITAFARREGLDVQRLRVWRRRLAVAVPAPTSTSFVEVARRAGDTTVEIALRSGHVVRVPASVDAEALRRIVEVLERVARDSAC